MSWNKRDLITYAIGVGAKKDEFKFVYGTKLWHSYLDAISYVGVELGQNSHCLSCVVMVRILVPRMTISLIFIPDLSLKLHRSRPIIRSTAYLSRGSLTQRRFSRCQSLRDVSERQTHSRDGEFWIVAGERIITHSITLQPPLDPNRMVCVVINGRSVYSCHAPRRYTPRNQFKS